MSSLQQTNKQKQNPPQPLKMRFILKTPNNKIKGYKENFYQKLETLVRYKALVFERSSQMDEYFCVYKLPCNQKKVELSIKFYYFQGTW